MVEVLIGHEVSESYNLSSDSVTRTNGGECAANTIAVQHRRVKSYRVVHSVVALAACFVAAYFIVTRVSPPDHINIQQMLDRPPAPTPLAMITGELGNAMR